MEVSMSTTILLSHDAGRRSVSIHRPTAPTRLLARIHSVELDRRLADGANPDSSALLSLRAQHLQSLASRRALALGFRRRLAAARRAPHPFDRRVPLARAEIRRNATLIEELATRLEAREPADPRGIARGRVLLCDGSSPLYSRASETELGWALQRAIDGLTLPPSTVSAD
jgi:hypothetical protein